MVPHYRKVDEAGNTEADTPKDSGKHETSRYTESKKDRDNYDILLVYCWRDQFSMRGMLLSKEKADMVHSRCMQKCSDIVVPC